VTDGDLTVEVTPVTAPTDSSVASESEAATGEAVEKAAGARTVAERASR
jgi:hypothetical protein